MTTTASDLLPAIAFAADKHRDQRRKDAAASPYINHPIALAQPKARGYRWTRARSGGASRAALTSSRSRDSLRAVRKSQRNCSRWRRGFGSSYEARPVALSAPGRLAVRLCVQTDQAARPC